MYFWNIDGLIADLRRGSLSQRDGFAYLVAMLLVYLVSPPGEGQEEAGTGPVLLYLASIAVLPAGTYAAYRANGGAEGVDFVGRYLALGWVLSLRLLGLLFPSYAIAVVLVWALVAWNTGSDETAFLGLPLWIIATITVGYNVIYFWRLVHHFRRLRSP